MTSTNDENEVKSNQTSGQKGKSYYIDLYKAQESALSSVAPLTERNAALCRSWRSIHELCVHSAPSTHPHLLVWLQRHTARTVLQSEWQSPNSANERERLNNTINDFISETKAVSEARGSTLEWEGQLLQQAVLFKNVLHNPWGHPVLKQLLDKSQEPPDDEQILGWLKEEQGLMFVMRLRQLATSKCDDIALTLATAVMSRVRASLKADTEDPKPEGQHAKYGDILSEQAGFTSEVWDLLTDIEFVLLHKLDEDSTCIELATQTPLRRGYKLVERLRTRLESSPREKKLWKNAKEVATLIVQTLIARCMMEPVCADLVRSALFSCSRSLVRLLPESRLPTVTATLAAPAASARHLHTLAQATREQCPPEMKEFVCSLYVRAITAGMNELEKLKPSKTEMTSEARSKQEIEARSTEQMLASWFMQLGSLLKASPRISCECLLTAFSVHPSRNMYEELGRAPPMNSGQPRADLEPKEETISEFGSWATDSHSISNLVKTSETLNLKHSRKQKNVLSVAILNEGETLGLGAELCADLAALLSGPRVKTFSWDMDREKLLENCRTYMEQTAGGTRAISKELKFLNLDLSQFRHLPEEDDGEDDVYYGIEKGYEHLVELQEPEPEEIWAYALSDHHQSSDESSSQDEEKRKKKKHKKPPVISSDDDRDPLSLNVESKRQDKPKKERPHSKERNKLKKQKSKAKEKDSKEGTELNEKGKPKKKREKKKPTHPVESISLPSLVGLNINREVTDQTTGTSEPKKEKKKRIRKPKQSVNATKVPGITLEPKDKSNVMVDGLFSMDDIQSPSQPPPHQKASNANLSNMFELKIPPSPLNAVQSTNSSFQMEFFRQLQRSQPIANPIRDNIEGKFKTIPPEPISIETKPNLTKVKPSSSKQKSTSARTQSTVRTKHCPPLLRQAHSLETNPAQKHYDPLCVPIFDKKPVQNFRPAQDNVINNITKLLNFRKKQNKNAIVKSQPSTSQQDLPPNYIAVEQFPRSYGPSPRLNLAQSQQPNQPLLPPSYSPSLNSSSQSSSYQSNQSIAPPDYDTSNAQYRPNQTMVQPNSTINTPPPLHRIHNENVIQKDITHGAAKNKLLTNYNSIQKAAAPLNLSMSQSAVTSQTMPSNIINKNLRSDVSNQPLNRNNSFTTDSTTQLKEKIPMLAYIKTYYPQINLQAIKKSISSSNAGDSLKPFIKHSTEVTSSTLPSTNHINLLGTTTSVNPTPSVKQTPKSNILQTTTENDYMNPEQLKTVKDFVNELTQSVNSGVKAESLTKKPQTKNISAPMAHQNITHKSSDYSNSKAFINDLFESVNTAPQSDALIKQRTDYNFKKAEQQPVSQSTELINCIFNQNSIQSAKQKKGENAPNTFARLSYIHKNKQPDIKSKQTHEAPLTQQELISQELEKRIVEHQLNKIKASSKTHLMVKKTNHGIVTNKNTSLINQTHLNEETRNSHLANNPMLQGISPGKVSSTVEKNTVHTQDHQNDIWRLLNQQNSLITARSNPIKRAPISVNSYLDANIVKPQVSTKPEQKKPAITILSDCIVKHVPNQTTSQRKQPVPGIRNKHINSFTKVTKKNVAKQKLPTIPKKLQVRDLKITKQYVSAQDNPNVNAEPNIRTVDNVSEKQQDWTSVFDALRSHKTPSRVPNALELTVNKKPLPTTDLKNTESNALRNTQLDSLLLESNLQKTSDSNRTPITLYTANRAETKIEGENVPTIIKVHARKRPFKKSTKLNQLPVFGHKSEDVHNLLNFHNAPTDFVLSYKQSQEPKTVSSTAVHDTFTASVTSQETEDYALLDEYFDPELLKEIGELSSDDEFPSTITTNVSMNAKQQIDFGKIRKKKVPTHKGTIDDNNTFSSSADSVFEKELKTNDLITQSESINRIISSPTEYVSNINNMQMAAPKIDTDTVTQNIPLQANSIPNNTHINNATSTLNKSNVLLANAPSNLCGNVLLIRQTDICDTLQFQTTQPSRLITSPHVIQETPGLVCPTAQILTPIVNQLIVCNNMIPDKLLSNTSLLYQYEQRTSQQVNKTDAFSSTTENDMVKQIEFKKDDSTLTENALQSNNNNMKKSAEVHQDTTNQSRGIVAMQNIKRDDINNTKNFERKVLSEVQETNNQDNTDHPATDISDFAKFNMKKDDENELERIQRKRMTIINREVNTYSYKPAIPLGYEPLVMEQTFCADKNLTSAQSQSCNMQVKYPGDYNLPEVVNEKSTDNALNNTEYCKENKSCRSVRRKHLRSSNKLCVPTPNVPECNDDIFVNTKECLKEPTADTDDKLNMEDMYEERHILKNKGTTLDIKINSKNIKRVKKKTVNDVKKIKDIIKSKRTKTQSLKVSSKAKKSVAVDSENQTAKNLITDYRSQDAKENPVKDSPIRISKRLQLKMAAKDNSDKKSKDESDKKSKDESDKKDKGSETCVPLNQQIPKNEAYQTKILGDNRNVKAVESAESTNTSAVASEGINQYSDSLSDKISLIPDGEVDAAINSPELDLTCLDRDLKASLPVLKAENTKITKKKRSLKTHNKSNTETASETKSLPPPTRPRLKTNASIPSVSKNKEIDGAYNKSGLTEISTKVCDATNKGIHKSAIKNCMGIKHNSANEDPVSKVANKEIFKDINNGNSICLPKNRLQESTTNDKSDGQNLNKNTMLKECNPSLSQDIPESYKDKMSIEVLSHIPPKNGEPFKQILRLKSPHGVAYRITVHGSNSVHIDTLMKNPTVRSIIIDGYKQTKKFTFSVNKISSGKSLQVVRPVGKIIDTVSLLSDEEDENQITSTENKIEKQRDSIFSMTASTPENKAEFTQISPNMKKLPTIPDSEEKIDQLNTKSVLTHFNDDTQISKRQIVEIPSCHPLINNKQHSKKPHELPQSNDIETCGNTDTQNNDVGEIMYSVNESNLTTTNKESQSCKSLTGQSEPDIKNDDNVILNKKLLDIENAVSSNLVDHREKEISVVEGSCKSNHSYTDIVNAVDHNTDLLQDDADCVNTVNYSMADKETVISEVNLKCQKTFKETDETLLADVKYIEESKENEQNVTEEERCKANSDKGTIYSDIESDTEEVLILSDDKTNNTKVNTDDHKPQTYKRPSQERQVISNAEDSDIEVVCSITDTENVISNEYVKKKCEFSLDPPIIHDDSDVEEVCILPYQSGEKVNDPNSKLENMDDLIHNILEPIIKASNINDPEVIDLDDSSDEVICVEEADKFIELRNKLLCDLGVMHMKSKVKRPRKQNGKSVIENKINSCRKCFVKVHRCDHLVSKYRHLKVMKRTCSVKLIRCDHLFKKMKDQTEEKSDELSKLCLDEIDGDILRAESPSILNEMLWSDNAVASCSTPIPAEIDYSECGHTSPVIEIFESIADLKRREHYKVYRPPFNLLDKNDLTLSVNSVNNDKHPNDFNTTYETASEPVKKVPSLVNTVLKQLNTYLDVDIQTKVPSLVRAVLNSINAKGENFLKPVSAVATNIDSIMQEPKYRNEERNVIPTLFRTVLNLINKDEYVFESANKYKNRNEAVLKMKIPTLTCSVLSSINKLLINRTEILFVSDNKYEKRNGAILKIDVPSLTSTVLCSINKKLINRFEIYLEADNKYENRNEADFKIEVPSLTSTALSSVNKKSNFTLKSSHIFEIPRLVCMVIKKINNDGSSLDVNYQLESKNDRYKTKLKRKREEFGDEMINVDKRLKHSIGGGIMYPKLHTETLCKSTNFNILNNTNISNTLTSCVNEPYSKCKISANTVILASKIKSSTWCKIHYDEMNVCDHLQNKLPCEENDTISQVNCKLSLDIDDFSIEETLKKRQNIINNKETFETEDMSDYRLKAPTFDQDTLIPLQDVAVRVMKGENTSKMNDLSNKNIDIVNMINNTKQSEKVEANSIISDDYANQIFGEISPINGIGVKENTEEIAMAISTNNCNQSCESSNVLCNEISGKYVFRSLDMTTPTVKLQSESSIFSDAFTRIETTECVNSSKRKFEDLGISSRSSEIINNTEVMELIERDVNKLENQVVVSDAIYEDPELIEETQKNFFECDNLLQSNDHIFESQATEVSSCTTPINDENLPIILKGIEYTDPEIGIVYILRPIDSCSETESVKTCSSTPNTFQEDYFETLQVSEDECTLDDETNEVPECNSRKPNMDTESETDIKGKKSGLRDESDKNLQFIPPQKTYVLKNFKRKLETKDTKLYQKRYRKGRNIDFTKISVSTIQESSIKANYSKVLEYMELVDFSYTRPFHKDEVDVEDAMKNWPITTPITDKTQLHESEYDCPLFKTEDYHNDPLEQSFLAEISPDYLETDFKVSEDTGSNFDLGFGERSGRVIQNLEDGGDISKFSAATLSDVKQSQPFLLSENQMDNSYQKSSTLNDSDYRRYLTYLLIRFNVRSFFENMRKELRDGNLQGMRDNTKDTEQQAVYQESLIFDKLTDLNSTKFIRPADTPQAVYVVQVGQLPVSAAAQNPVTCDPRVTQVSNASPSQCSVDNSPLSENNQANISAEYTELTNADMRLPLVQNFPSQTESIHSQDNYTKILTENHEMVLDNNKNADELRTEPLDENDISIKEETSVIGDLKQEEINDIVDDYKPKDINDKGDDFKQQDINHIVDDLKHKRINRVEDDLKHKEINHFVDGLKRHNINHIVDDLKQQDINHIEDDLKEEEINHIVNDLKQKDINHTDFQYNKEDNNCLINTPNQLKNDQYNAEIQDKTLENFDTQKQENGYIEKTDQIAHAMNAAGITITSDMQDSFVNDFDQKEIQPNKMGPVPNSTNSYPKTGPINALALQQALAQILPPVPSQNSNNDNAQHGQNASVGHQVLHIVHGKSSSGNQITLVDNSQQSVINGPNATQVLHIVQNKASAPNQALPNQTNTFSGLSLVDAGLQQGGNQLLHIVNTGNPKNNTAGQLLKRVNLLTNLTNVQGANEQKMVQFVCKSADGKAIHLNAPHQRSMVLRLQPIETPNVQAQPSKTAEQRDPSPNQAAKNAASNDANQQEIKSRSIYEENYAKFIKSANNPVINEKSTSLPKFNQAFGKAGYQDSSQKHVELSPSSHIPQAEDNQCSPTENAINFEHISQVGSPPLLRRKTTSPTSQNQTNIVQQIKQTIAPVNLQTMHGGVIYTRQIPVNIGGGQTINLITVPSTDLMDEKQTVNQNETEPSIIKIVPQSPAPNAEVSPDDNTPHLNVSSDNAQTPHAQPVLTQMRIKLPMLSKAPQVVSGSRVVRPSFFQIQRNVIGGANQQVYQQLVLTAAPPLGQQTIRLPQSQVTKQVKVTSESTSESQLSSSTLEQLREFDMVLEQVKERSTVQPGGGNPVYTKLPTPSTDTTDSGISISTTCTEQSQQILYTINNNQTMNVAYVNRKSTVAIPTTSFVRSPDSTGVADSPSSSHIPTSSDSTTSPENVQSKPAARIGSRRSRPSRPSSHAMKVNHVPPKASNQKPVEDEQTTQRILYILAEYKEQVENSPDKDKPAPRRRSNPPSNPGSSKRKKSHSGSRRPGCTREHSPSIGDDCRTIGSEDSSCGTSQGDCNESCSIDALSPQDSPPRKIARKLTYEQETPMVSQPKPQPPRNVIVADGQTITVARGTTGKPTTAVLMPANYILPVSMVKGGQQIAIVTNRGPKLLTVGGGGSEAGTTNALLLQRVVGTPAGLKPVLTRPGVRHVRLPTGALHTLQGFNFTTTTQSADSSASSAQVHTSPELKEARTTSSPWTERDSGSEVKPERGSSPEGSEPWNLQSADPPDYTYEEPRANNLDRTVLDPIHDRYSPDMEAQRIFDKMFDGDAKKPYITEPHDDARVGPSYDIDTHSDCDDKAYHQVVQKKDGASHSIHRVTHFSASALRHKYAILEQELRLQKSLSEECEDLGVDSPSASELFPEAELLFANSPAAYEQVHEQAHVHVNTPQPQVLSQSLPQPEVLSRSHVVRARPLAPEVRTVHLPAAIAREHEEFARDHPNTTFHSDQDAGDREVQPFSISSSLKTRHVYHANNAPATVLMTTPAQTVISQNTGGTSGGSNAKFDLDLINLVKDDGLTRFDSILTDSRELHLSHTASSVVHPNANTTQVIRRVCYDDKRERDRFLMDETDIIAGDDAKMNTTEDSRDGALESADDDESSTERHAELFWESNSASERSESRRPLDFSSDSEKCCKSPSLDETYSTDSSGLGTHLRLDSVIKQARSRDRSGSMDNSSADDTVHPPIRTYPPKRQFHSEHVERSLSGKTRAGERSPECQEVRRRASVRGVVKRGCHCCNGSPPRAKKPRQRKPTLDFTSN